MFRINSSSEELDVIIPQEDQGVIEALKNAVVVELENYRNNLPPKRSIFSAEIKTSTLASMITAWENIKTVSAAIPLLYHQLNMIVTTYCGKSKYYTLAKGFDDNPYKEGQVLIDNIERIIEEKLTGEHAFLHKAYDAIHFYFRSYLNWPLPFLRTCSEEDLFGKDGYSGGYAREIFNVCLTLPLDFSAFASIKKSMKEQVKKEYSFILQQLDCIQSRIQEEYKNFEKTANNTKEAPSFLRPVTDT